jgi:hypothetical protein
MRQISVSTEVYSLIWGARLPGEESEDEILLRLLSSPKPSLPKASNFQPNPQESKMSGVNLSMPTSLHHAYWWQVVEFVLEQLGRPSSLSEIYRGVVAVCEACDRRMPQEIEATVRGTLEDNSSDSDRFKHVRDIFCMPEGKHTGVWALRRKQA